MLISTFASSSWRMEYKEGVETKPDIGYLFAYDIGYLFAYSTRDIKVAKLEMGYTQGQQFFVSI